MKALSLWEPHASLMMLGAKKIETRSWQTKYRGPLLICAAQKLLPMDKWNYFLRRNPVFYNALRPLTKTLGERALDVTDLNFGKAVCIVDLADCIPTKGPLTPGLACDEIHFGNYTPGRFAWITTNLRRFEIPFPIKGGQRIFNVPMEIIEKHLLEGGQAFRSN